MKKIRLSYSLLACWDRGDTQGAIDTYFHIKKEGTDAMNHGLDIHKQIEECINSTNAFPEWFFKYPLVLPETEKSVVVSYNDMFDLKGVYDCLDSVSKTLFEFKTGNSDSLAWARTWQIPMYFLIAELAQIDIEKAILIRNNKDKSDFCVVHNSKRLRDRARNIIDSLGPEIHQFFTEQGLI